MVSLRVNKNRSGNVFARLRFREEGMEAVVFVADLVIKVAVLFDSMLEAVKLPGRVCSLNSSLPDVDGENFAMTENHSVECTGIWIDSKGKLENLENCRKKTFSRLNTTKFGRILKSRAEGSKR